MRNERSREGYLLIDNRAPGTGGGSVLEFATLTCSHCQRQMIRNPARVRERARCVTCDHFICDPCAALRRVADCKTFKAFMDEQDTLHHRARFSGQ